MREPIALRARRVLTIFGLAVGLNYVWELAQTPFYEGVALPGALWHCFIASLGDGVIVLVIFAAVASALHATDWYIRPTSGSYLITALTGFVLAVVVEWWGLHIAKRWQYSTLMPIIPMAEVGVVPVLQMLVLPPLIFSFAKRLAR